MECTEKKNFESIRLVLDHNEHSIYFVQIRAKDAKSVSGFINKKDAS